MRVFIVGVCCDVYDFRACVLFSFDPISRLDAGIASVEKKSVSTGHHHNIDTK